MIIVGLGHLTKGLEMKQVVKRSMGSKKKVTKKVIKSKTPTQLEILNIQLKNIRFEILNIKIMLEDVKKVLNPPEVSDDTHLITSKDGILFKEFMGELFDTYLAECCKDQEVPRGLKEVVYTLNNGCSYLFLSSAFSWRNTKQGYDYWFEVETKWSTLLNTTAS